MAKYKRFEPEEGIYELRDLAKGEFFRRVRKDGTPYGPSTPKATMTAAKKLTIAENMKTFARAAFSNLPQRSTPDLLTEEE